MLGLKDHVGKDKITMRAKFMLTDRFDDAFRYAHRLHQSQTRKGTSIPYISHLMTVSALVVEHGGNAPA
jgi:(p)ppGpp synthase/HD superfamily hydrolase